MRDVTLEGCSIEEIIHWAGTVQRNRDAIYIFEEFAQESKDIAFEMLFL